MLQKDMKKFLESLRNELDFNVQWLSMEKVEKGGREISLVITKLQEARLWAGEAMKVRGDFETKASDLGVSQTD